MANSTRLISRQADFQRKLRIWYRTHARPLPWRESPSLYKTVVSEFMLQQTQVKTVLPYFARWLATLPDFAALAAAPEAKVLKLWEGLGYYSRARNLHKLAQSVTTLPIPPRTPDAWRALPGVGPYTAAAITSIAFGAPAAVVDGNVVRILARLTADKREFRDSSTAAKEFTSLANALLPTTNPGDHNQAMMELGATVCVRQNPGCPDCPVAEFCIAHQRGHPEKLPRLQPKVIERMFVIRTFCLEHGRLLLRCRDAQSRRLGGLHELPEATDVGVKPAAGDLLLTKRRSITRFQITESIYTTKPSAVLKTRVAATDSLVWVPLTELDSITLSGPHRRWVHAILAQPTP